MASNVEPAPSPEPDSMAQQLMTRKSLQLGACFLSINVNFDCIVGNDPQDVDTVVAYSACINGCRDAIVWAMRTNRTMMPPASQASTGAGEQRLR